LAQITSFRHDRAAAANTAAGSTTNAIAVGLLFGCSVVDDGWTSDVK